MPIPIIEIESDGAESIYSPFTGKAVDNPEGQIKIGPSVIFVTYGMANGFETKSESVKNLVENHSDAETDEHLVEWLASRLDIPGAFILRVNRGWNGVDSYCFRPVPTE